MRVTGSGECAEIDFCCWAVMPAWTLIGFFWCALARSYLLWRSHHSAT